MSPDVTRQGPQQSGLTVDRPPATDAVARCQFHPDRRNQTRNTILGDVERVLDLPDLQVEPERELCGNDEPHDARASINRYVPIVACTDLVFAMGLHAVSLVNARSKLPMLMALMGLMGVAGTNGTLM